MKNELSDQQVLDRASEILSARFTEKMQREFLKDESAIKRLIQLKIASLPYEAFVVVFLDGGNRVIAIEELARGTLTNAVVHPRELVKRVLHHNAHAVVFAHNHPSASSEPSLADIDMTSDHAKLLGALDTMLVDHYVVNEGTVTSMKDYVMKNRKKLERRSLERLLSAA